MGEKVNMLHVCIHMASQCNFDENWLIIENYDRHNLK